jgi:ABC-2 type transport system permease protein
MNFPIARLTARMLLGQRRTVIVLLLALLPVGIALLFRFSAPDTTDPERFTSRGLLGGIVTTTILPLISLIFATGAFGQDIEDGTAVYLLATPIPRRDIVVTRIVVAWLAAAALLVPSTAVAGAIAIQSGDPGIVLGFTVAMAAGTLIYAITFTWLSIATSRALVAGLLYVFLWEGALSGLFGGIRFLSIRQYTAGIAGAFFDLPATVYQPRLDPAPAIILGAVVGVLFLVLAVRRLQRWEVGEAA